MYEMMYLELNAVCALMLAIVLLCWKRSADRSVDSIAFRNVALATIAILCFDMVWMHIDGNPGLHFVWINRFVNALYMFQTALISYLWLIYTKYKLSSRKKFTRKLLMLWAIPLAVFFLLCFSSPWTGWIFSVGDDNVYRRGPLYIVQVITAYGYLAVSLARMLAALVREKNAQTRIELKTLLAFYALPSAAGVISAACFGLPILWPATSLSLLLVYVNMQSYQISTDSLTGLNNRRQFDKYLHYMLSDTRKQDRFCLFLMDINAFKRINDTFGHLQGDEALRQTSKMLQSVCNSKDAFLARYGGDEFAIIFKCDGIDDARALRDAIAAAFAERNLAPNTLYPITLSVGLACYSPTGASSASALIATADEELYRAKQKYADAER